MKKIEHYKEKLEHDLLTLQAELATVGVKNPNVPGDWEAKLEDIDIMSADPNEAADRIEAEQESRGVLTDLEVRSQNVERALKKIADGKFGTCEVCGEEIEEDRLEVAPSARTCKKDMENERGLPL